MADLILIPTDAERDSIEASLNSERSHWTIETIGFGVIAAGVASLAAISKHRPSRAILVGVAGLFSDRQSDLLRLGDAVSFRSVTIDGIGVGSGEDFVDAWQMGWPWAGSREFELSVAVPCEHQLLTVCAASATPAEATSRRRRFPDAVAEDMEGFAVAQACQLAGVTLTIVRGLSNLVGHRDKSTWCFERSLDSAAICVQSILDSDQNSQ